MSRKLALRTGFAVVMLAVPLVATWHLAAAQSSGAARIRFDTVEHDFGKVPSGTKMTSTKQSISDSVADLEAAYGAPSQAGFGSAVFYEQKVTADDLEKVALASTDILSLTCGSATAKTPGWDPGEKSMRARPAKSMTSWLNYGASRIRMWRFRCR